ncbi:response regulator transcription factor [Pedobacter nutrimenti]|jgi:DNA-binding response OmpR family regulator|uniref:Two-component system alkaline phosphatase synthesis response regulator PhoP n=1 Tax=Pedobacter nutrimenti TaxID=1241337 RepID=A0A318UAD7_9SPHI|nr:response regulator [Pedobacter nutrimenti]PYF69982.1 two-component system alkaline phosphatase synthesis response regulator PhoP [Pedobacter nutrimenti]
MAKRIFVLEDDHDIRDVFELLLKEEGYELELSSSFSELKELLKKSVPDLFVIDVMLPDANGIDVCKDLKAQSATRNIPVIVMSANARSKQMSVQACADDYIGKPFDIAHVMNKIDKLLLKPL